MRSRGADIAARGAPARGLGGPVLAFAPLAWAGACVALAWLPIAAATPPWISAAVGACIAIRLGLAAAGADAPPALLRFPAAALAIAVYFAQHRTFNGVTAGTALLVLTAGLKMLEARSPRDLYVVALIVYFLGLAALLAHDEFWTLGYLVAVCWLNTAALLQRDPHERALRPRASLAYSARVLAQALPLALALWLFFPRLAAPLWRLEAAGGASVTGLGDTMSPGDIDDLAMSDAIAFHARFLGAAPPRPELYWRGPVLEDFDGRTWRRGDRRAPGRVAQADAAAPAASRGSATTPMGGSVYRYRIEFEPYPHDWLYALDRPVSAELPGARLDPDGVLVRPGHESAPSELVAVSRTGPADAAELDADVRRRDTRLPAGSNPRTRAWALALRASHPRDAALVTAVLARFHEDPYYYTLRPPLLGRNAVDEFLFVTRRGFCEHYASAFAVVMRAAGIPARVVTGFFGGTFNAYSGDWIVRESEAHAWDEVWLAGRGWLRVDPTAAIAPERVDPTLRDAARTPGAFALAAGRDAPWAMAFALRLDALRTLWRDRILRYDPRAQRSLLERLHVPDPDAAKLAAALGAALMLGFAWLAWQARRELARTPRDRLERAYAALSARLAAAGLARLPHEGPEGYARRVAAVRPDLARAVADLCREYASLRYGRVAPADRVRAFGAAVRAFRPRGSRASAGTRRRASAPRSTRD